VQPAGQGAPSASATGSNSATSRPHLQWAVC